ncbi:MAG TPA: hypothetical protein VK934_10415 [Fimbriimonas sp.]|nr:hypothetical protein [Fimbriimonas sp.]
MQRRDFLKLGGLALLGGPETRLSLAVMQSRTSKMSSLGEAFCSAQRHYLRNSEPFVSLYASYLAVKPKFVPTATKGQWPLAVSGALAEVLKRGILRFGYARDSAPYVFHAGNGELAGIDWEMGNALTAIIREKYFGAASNKGLVSEWVGIDVPAGGDPEASKFSALYSGLAAGKFDIALTGQANISASPAGATGVDQVDWSNPTELLFTNILYSGRDNFSSRLAPLVGGSRDDFIKEIQSWPTQAIFMCVVNPGPSQTNVEALCSDIGKNAKLIKSDTPGVLAAIRDQSIHFSSGDAVASSYQAVAEGFKGMNMNIAAAKDALGTAQDVAAFMLKGN